SSLNLNLIDVDGINEMYVSFGTIPTRQTHDFAALSAAPSQRIVFTDNHGGGTYYILVYGSQIQGTNNWQLTAETGNLIVVGLGANRLGNATPATLAITGAAFDEATTVQFIGTNGVVRSPASTSIASPDTLLLNLDLPDWLAGFYDV